MNKKRNSSVLSPFEKNLYVRLNDTLKALHSNILQESLKRIKIIKQSTSLAMELIKSLTITIRSDFINHSIFTQTIPKIKALLQKCDHSFKNQIEHFGTDIAVIEIENSSGSFSTKESPMPVFAESISSSKSLCNLRPQRWSIINHEGQRKNLPEWIESQINNGIKYNCKEIMVYQGSVIKSIANINEMKYYWADSRGNKSGKGQALFKD